MRLFLLYLVGLASLAAAAARPPRRADFFADATWRSRVLVVATATSGTWRAARNAPPSQQAAGEVRHRRGPWWWSKSPPPRSSWTALAAGTERARNPPPIPAIDCAPAACCLLARTAGSSGAAWRGAGRPGFRPDRRHAHAPWSRRADRGAQRSPPEPALGCDWHPAGVERRVPTRAAGLARMSRTCHWPAVSSRESQFRPRPGGDALVSTPRHGSAIAW